MAAHLLDEHRDLDRTQAEPAGRFGLFEREPALVDHRGPQIDRPGIIGLGMGAHARRRREIVEELARGRAERELIFREVEVHSGKGESRASLRR